MLSHMCTKSALITLNVVSFTTETIRGGRTGAGMAFSGKLIGYNIYFTYSDHLLTLHD